MQKDNKKEKNPGFCGLYTKRRSLSNFFLSLAILKLELGFLWMKTNIIKININTNINLFQTHITCTHLSMHANTQKVPKTPYWGLLRELFLCFGAGDQTWGLMNALPLSYALKRNSFFTISEYQAVNTKAYLLIRNKLYKQIIILLIIQIAQF